MEGFRSDSVKPFPPIVEAPLSSDEPVVAAMAETGNTSRKRSRQVGLERTESLVMERDRRLKMSQMYAQLQSTVPGLFSKATREVIVNETINYIKDLEKKKKILEELKRSTIEPEVAERKMMLMLPCTSNRNSSITVTVSGNTAFFGIQSKAQSGLITVIFKVFFKHNAEILAANVSVNNGELTLAITASLGHNSGDDGNVTVEKIKTEILSL